MLNYKFEGSATNTGRTAPDYNAIAQSVDYVLSQDGLGDAAQFKANLDDDEDTAWVRIDNIQPLLQSMDALTLGVWFKQETITTDGVLLDFLASANGSGGGIRISNGADSETLEACFASSSEELNCGDIDLGAGYDGSQWHHLLVHLPQSNGNVEIQIDGVTELVLTNGGSASILNALMANSMTWGFASGFIIDEIKIFDRSFDAQEQCVLIIEGTWNNVNSSCDSTPTGND